MPIIQHRFRNELEQLEIQPLSGHYHLLIVGTFNPEDIDGLNNYAKWFYGRCENRFWYLLPTTLGHDSLHIYDNHDQSLNQLGELWRNYCTEHRILITDIYKSVNADLTNFTDDDIENPLDHEAFNYAQAFQNCTFDAVIITRKTWNKNTVIGELLNEVTNYFTAVGTPVLRLHSPGPRGRADEATKLAYWREKYDAL